MQLPELYHQMARARAFELAVAELWHRGHISGEMHSGVGEEAIAAGVVTLLRREDGLALTHRCSPALVVRGVPLEAMLHEFLGHAEGLSGGRSGHMNVMSREYLVATSGIVGASLPRGAGFALAAKRLRPGAIGVAFTGDGAMNQGMALETLNLAKAWSLPLLLVCIDNGWALTTRAGTVTGGELPTRVRAFGWSVTEVDGTDVEAVHAAAGDAIDDIRAGRGPAMLYATCPRIEGHFLGDPMLDQARNLTSDATRQTIGQIVSAAVSPDGGGTFARVASVAKLVGALGRARVGPRQGDRHDPMQRVERAMKSRAAERERIDATVRAEIEAAVTAATKEADDV